MRLTPFRPFLNALAASSVLTSAADAQAFVLNTGNVPASGPANSSTSENVDFADVDLDGDWDAVFADGGNEGNDQNRVWINQGGLQAGEPGVFADETLPRFPVFADTSRDIDLADVDGDLDPDIYVANTSFISLQGNRWMINSGSLQGGTLGFFTEETAQRWVDLNGPESSIAPQLLLPNPDTPATFIDWACDCDFADLDNDGDLDLVHSSYGNTFSGDVPTRLFTNDGRGYFREFNPSGFQLTFSEIAAGSPGLWCEGTHEPNTTAIDGTRCDVATTALDTDVGDVDGDFDLDIVHGARNEQPRLFQNRSAENGGPLGFRDVTAAAFSPGSSAGEGHYEQELGDLDSDGDLDLFGCNWLVAFDLDDLTFENDGSGVFAVAETLANGSDADMEGDFLDYDADGDLDLFVVAAFGPNRLYRNDADGGPRFSFTDVTELLPALGPSASLDLDGADVDSDGDTDVFEAVGNGGANRFWENVTQARDATPPTVHQVETVTGHVAVAGFDPIRALIYDNAPYYVTYCNPTKLELSVDGVELPALSMTSSGGQVFRGELPANLVGRIEVRVSSTDGMGNEGSSAPVGYRNTGPTGTASGAGTPSSVGSFELSSLTAPLAGMPLHLVARETAPGSSVVFAFSLSSLPSVVLGDGLVLNLGFPLLGVPAATVSGSDGAAALSLAATPASAAGVTVFAQAWAADGAGGATWASSPGLALDFQ